MTQRSLSANKAAPRVTHGERERESVDGGERWSERRCNKWCKNKNLRGRNSKWVTVSQDSRKKRKQRTARRGGEKGKTESPRGRRPARSLARSSPASKVRRDREEAPRGRGDHDTSVAACFVLCHTEGPRAGKCTAQRPAARFSINLCPFIAATSQRCPRRHRFSTSLRPQTR